jgi:preprotein translocase subunit SecE
MSTRVEAASSMPDVLKWIAAAALFAAGLIGFYFFAEHSTLLRVVGLLFALALSVVVAVQTVRGRSVWDFMRDSRTEVRKVVWPTRQETVQTTLIVMAVVALMAVIMWALDSLLGFLVRLLLEQGG